MGLSRIPRALAAGVACWLMGCGTEEGTPFRVGVVPAAYDGGPRALGAEAGASESPRDGGGADGAPSTTAKPRGVMLQGFYWNVPATTDDGGWWRHLEAMAPSLAQAGFGSVWIPPPYKGYRGTSDVGYGVYDRYDLGEFDQRGAVATRYGTRAELVTMIGAFHATGIQVYADVVMNHMMGADRSEAVTTDAGAAQAPTRYTFPGRGTTHSAFVWDQRRFNGCARGSSWTQWQPWDFTPYAGGDAWDNLLGCEVRYADEDTQVETIRWGQWLTSTLELDGYRLDATKHMVTGFVNRWLDEVKGPRFAVSEAWFGNLDHLRAYVTQTGRRTTLFDVPLHYAFSAMSAGNGAWDMRGLRGAGLTAVDGEVSVPFVDNHDTDTPGGGLYSPVTNFKMLAYAYVLLRAEGYPCVFLKDYDEYGYGEGIRGLLRLRESAAAGAGREHDESDANVYVYERMGSGAAPGLVLLLNDGPATTKKVATHFAGKTLRDGAGQSDQVVRVDASGSATFPVPAGGYGVWVPEVTKVDGKSR